MEPSEHLFRRESGRIVATLTRIFGLQNLALAEDLAQEAFCRALEVWRLRGVPDNPAAWLMATAKNLAVDAFRRERTARTFAPELNRLLQIEQTPDPVIAELFASNAIKDDMLRMMFSCCPAQLPEEAQVTLILHILCGFGVNEIAGAFVTTETAIKKRITRSKKILARSKTVFDVRAAAEFSSRLPAVHRALYLLFNEGYHGAADDAAVHAGLCREAMRLTAILLEHPSGKTSSTFALAALMCLNAARLPSRLDASDNLNSLFDQDRSLWDRELIGDGLGLLELSATDCKPSAYHIEAAIAFIHARTERTEETDWASIVSLYDTLMTIQPSPIVALNRAIAIAQNEGPARGLEELREISDIKRLGRYPFYWAALGELELRRGRRDIATEHFRTAIAQARNPTERRFLEQRATTCEQGGHTGTCKEDSYGYCSSTLYVQAKIPRP